jgi:hypothetical protein
MKMKMVIAMLLLGISICAFACDERAERRVDERATKLNFTKNYKPYELNFKPHAPGYTLPLDLNDVVNIDKFDRIIEFDSISDQIRQNSFAIVEPETFSSLAGLASDDCLGVYKPLGWDGLLPFVTVDTVLCLYHTQFDETLKDIEERHLIPDVNGLVIALLNDAIEQHKQLEGELKEAAKRNIAYLSVARRLLDPKAPIPELVDEIVLCELAKIEAHQGFAASDIFIYEEDYSQYVPRGHYTRSEQLERYFKTMTWCGSMTFLVKGSDNWGATGEALVSMRDARIQTLQASLLVMSLKNAKVGERTGLDVWERLYSVTAFYVGLSDDLTPYDYLFALNKVFEAGFVLADLTDESNLFKLMEKLEQLPAPKIYGGTGNVVLDGPLTDKSLNETLDKTRGMCLMGRRFVPDSYMFQNLVFPQVGSYRGIRKERPFTACSDGLGGSYRAYVRGLDLMALLGSREALNILTDEGDTDFLRYQLRFGELKSYFDALSPVEWNVNLYWSWLYSLRALLQELPDGYPEFMLTKAWQRRRLHSALVSWTQLRHDTILHVKQGYPPPPASKLPTPPPGYVEPLPVFLGRLLSLTQMTSQGLYDLNILTPEARQRFNYLEELLQQMLDIVAKQLTNEPLAPEDRNFFKELPSRLNLMAPKERGQNQSYGSALVADVFANSLEARVVEEAVGKIDFIVVACPMPEGKAFLAVGPVSSYYEFKHPMSDRLTDEAWRKLLDSPKKPDRPQWYAPLVKTRKNRDSHEGHFYFDWKK